MGCLRVFWMPESIVEGKGRLLHCQFIGLGAESYKHWLILLVTLEGRW